MGRGSASQGVVGRVWGRGVPPDTAPCPTHKPAFHAGPEDPRLIVWPGKGLFMMFGSKPWPKDANGVLPEQTACEGPWAFQPFLIQLQSYAPQTAPADPWSKGIIRLQYLSGEELPPGALLKEKNWNPFIYKGKLLFSQVRAAVPV